MLDAEIKALDERVVDFRGSSMLLDPLPEKDQAAFFRKFLAALGVEPDAGYMELLEQTDGLVAEGVFVYSSQPRPIADEDDSSLAIIDANLQYREQADQPDHKIIYGDSDMDIYVHDTHKGVFTIESKVGGEVFHRFDTFEEMLGQILLEIEDRV